MMIEITIISSSSVKPGAKRKEQSAKRDFSPFSRPFALSSLLSAALPVTVLLSIQRRGLGFRMHVEDVFTTPRGGIDGVITGTKYPVCLPGHGINGNLSEIDFRFRDGRIAAGCFRR